jgi:curved DNA-binding protein CbpA
MGNETSKEQEVNQLKYQVQRQQREIQHLKRHNQDVENRYQVASDNRQKLQQRDTKYQPRLNQPVIQNIPRKNKMENSYQEIYQARQTLNNVYVPQAGTMVARQPMTIEKLKEDERNMIREYEEQERLRRRKFEDDLRKRRVLFENELKKMEKDVDLAYRILNIRENYDLKTLNKAYKLAALKYHPDRPGGNSEHFQLVTKSFMLLLEKYKKQNFTQKTMEEVKQEREEVPKFKVSSGEKFDLNMFNKIYAENRIYDVYDEGYGDWLRSEERKEKTDIPAPEIFSDKFNLNVFNNMFDLQKESQQQSIVKIENPSALPVNKQNDNFITLGSGNIADFSGYSGNLMYTDLKVAHTNQLIGPGEVSQNKNYKNLEHIMKDRENADFKLNFEDEQLYKRIEEAEKMKEKKRLEGLMMYDKVAEEHKRRVDQLFLKN